MKKYHVLVVDDNPEIRSLILTTLGNTFYDLAEAANGEQALQYLNTHDLPDLVILDLAMPGMSGMDVLQEIKASPETAQIEVVVLSANADQQKNHAISIGARAVIAKPFGPLALLQMVEDLFE